MNQWQRRSVPFKFQLSDWTVFSVPIELQVRAASLFSPAQSVAELVPPTGELQAGSQGFLIRGLPTSEKLPEIARKGDYFCYAPLQYQHCYIDFSLSFDDYSGKFSSKTRSTILRKIRKYTQHSGGTVHWKTYRRPEAMREFVQVARAVSKLTYQERLLDAGIPQSEEFIHEAEILAEQDRVRAYVLFDRERPVAYLYCPAQDGVLIYAYLGYDPDYLQWSVGTVLQWLAVEQLFSEAKFRYLDFTEGESEHKRLFATHQRTCANVFLVKRTLRNAAIVHGHRLMDKVSRSMGVWLSRIGLKAKIKRVLRFAM